MRHLCIFGAAVCVWMTMLGAMPASAEKPGGVLKMYMADSPASMSYLDGIEYTIIRNVSTAILAFTAGKFDMTFPYSVTVPLLKDVRDQSPQAICELAPTSVSRDLIVNRDKPPFDNPDLRRAMALSLDRKALIDIITEGQDS